MNRGQFLARSLPTRPGGNGPERMSGRTIICRNTPSNIMSPTRSQPGPSAEVSQGVRGHTPRPHQHAHAPPNNRLTGGKHPSPWALTQAQGTSKRSREMRGFRGGCRTKVLWGLEPGRRGVGVDRRSRKGAPIAVAGPQGPAVASWWRWSLVRLWLIRTNRHSVLTACLPR